MSSKLKISLSCGDYDRTRALFDGRAPIEGCEVTAVPLEPEEAFHRAFRYHEYDVTEISMSSHMMTTARGDNEYIAIPAFLSRVFRHSGIYVRTDRGIDKPQDLRGKTIGVPEYQITANVWIRGILEDAYGVKPQDIKWRRGGIEEPGRGERAPIELPDGIDLQQIPDDKTLSDMLEAGEIDGYIGARAPSCFLRGAPNVGRLFNDYLKTEQDYFRETRIFPIMHMVGIRRSLVEQNPWLPVSVYKAFLKAKMLAVKELNEICHLAVTLPWMVHHYNAARELMGDDYWPYGLDANRHVIETFARYHYGQGLSRRLVKPEELFAASSLDLSKI
ncbi:ABC transporter substrate-binding protein [Bordetella bronchiseptica]|uniref:ABC transporter substrate-binding protein n=1 Tax=Bordetella bronchiseptica TaxID=518 RepID=UPI00028B8F10|nr:ABC transporter substrate-binding protein [Bordetella bronchiseptica]KCV25921.1 NMT1/THI5 domain protein [Bordetella bronchiseptica 00-P-2730]KDD59638.1 NMT1/THI5 domain protein [Bordetella bronchiseptica OSU553]AUL13736.1 4,5-dihydroxyphthalate decarboxylase [Bordetella bronchiseptica]AWP56826.1 4,5-dihydroxyphthalate decarboxylase [Bordetella bronchiseptica]AWP78105.1 4,5-dihydroxyphthalate decarboxylase [Bordetella bronchiseptica]